jgi:hypothetical protein
MPNLVKIGQSVQELLIVDRRADIKLKNAFEAFPYFKTSSL